MSGYKDSKAGGVSCNGGLLLLVNREVKVPRLFLLEHETEGPARNIWAQGIWPQWAGGLGVEAGGK